MVDLYIRRDHERPHKRNYTDEQITIGKLAENLLVLDDDEVSRRHAVLECRADGWVVIDRTSKNGTWIGDERLPADVPRPLRQGAKLKIGPFTISFDVPHDDVIVPEDPAVTIQSPESEPPAASASSVIDELQTVWALSVNTAPAERARKLRASLVEYRKLIGDREFASLLHAIVDKLTPTHEDALPTRVGEDCYVRAHQTLEQLSASLLGVGDSFTTVEELTHFGDLLRTFVETTADWLHRYRTARAEMIETFGTEWTHVHGDVRNTIDGSREIALWTLDWRDPTKQSDTTRAKLAQLLRTFLAQHAAVLSGARDAAHAVMTALSPATIEEKARASAPFWSMKAKSSSSWTAFQTEWARLSEQIDAEIVSPKIREALRRMDADNQEKG